MGGLGWTGAYGVEGLRQVLRQRELDAIAAQKTQQELGQQGFENSLKLREQGSRESIAAGQEKDRQAAEVDRRANAAALAQRTQVDDTRQNVAMMPRGTDVTPIAGSLRMAGLGPLMAAQAPSLASTNVGQGALALPPDKAALSGQDYTQSAPALPARETLSGTAQEQQQAAANKRADAANARADAASQRAEQGALVQVNEGGQPVYRRAVDAVGQPAYKTPPQAQTVTIQTVDANGNAVTKIVPKTAGSEFVKPSSGTVENRLASARAVSQTGDDIIAQLSDPAFKAIVGPVMGRARTLQDFIGNPPPEFSDLAGKIESYALANMGVHGMRSAQGAEQIKQLLNAHHTPESLIAAIRGLSDFSRHFIENEGKGGGAKPAAATGAGFKVVGSRPAK